MCLPGYSETMKQYGESNAKKAEATREENTIKIQIKIVILLAEKL